MDSIEKIIELGKLGYSRDEISALMAVNTEGKKGPIEEPKKAEMPKAEIKEPSTITDDKTQLAQSEQITKTEDNSKVMSDEQFTKLLQTISAGNANIDVPPTVSLEDVLAKHYVSMFGGKPEETKKE